MDPLPGLVVTKLDRPVRRAGAIARKDLLERMRRRDGARVVLLSAPAGSGKTTLLAEWVASRDAQRQSTAWVSLDEGDADPVRFWVHTLAAIDAQVPGTTTAQLELLSAPKPPEITSVLAAVVNALATREQDLVLVLDDLHLVSDGVRTNPGEIVAGIGYLVDHLPTGMRVVLATRSDPSLPLARLRARGQLLELRASDLRLTEAEAYAFLTTTMALPVSEPQSAALHACTEGWVAGLQLAGLALGSRNTADVDAFIRDFAGSNRFVVDYLAEEIVHRQSPEVLDFLRRTCVLDRLTGPLCDAMRDAPAEDGDSDGEAMLRALERANLFVVPQDDTRTWYRYHPLFGDVLRLKLLPGSAGSDATARELHLRASHWFEAQGMQPEAIRHALRADELDRVADLVEALPQVQFVHPIQSSLRGWLAALPPGTVRSRPRLALLEAWRLLQDGDVGGAAELVDAAEERLDASGTGNPSEAETNARGEIEVIRGFMDLGGRRPEPEHVVRRAERALRLLPEENVTFRGMANLTLGHGALLAGDAVRAERAFTRGEEIGRTAGAPHVAVMSAVYLAAAQRLRGSHQEALATTRACLAWTDGHRSAVAGRVGLLHLLAGDLLLEVGDVEGARDHAEDALGSARLSALPPMLAYTLLGSARACAAAGQPDRALAALDEAVALLPRGASVDSGAATMAAPWHACRAQIQVRQGNLVTAEAWAARQTDVSRTSLLSGIRPGALAVAAGYECEHVRVAPAQVWLAVARTRDDEAALRRAVAHIDAQGEVVDRFRLGWLRVKLEVLRALAFATGGDEERAVTTLQDALALAGPEGHVRLFADEGRPMVALLNRVRQAGLRSAGPATTAYVDRLIVAAADRASEGGEGPTPVDALADPLSGRELEVLSLIAAGKGNADIARALYVAPSTVKTHVNHVFAKLGVASRTQAVARARELGVL